MQLARSFLKPPKKLNHAISLTILSLTINALLPSFAMASVAKDNQSNQKKDMVTPIANPVTELPLIQIINVSSNDTVVKNQPIELQDARIETSITGSHLYSKITLTLHNPNNRILEGELILPIAEGQKITGFSLDINGAMRPAVPVEKAKGQQVFEDVIREEVDPALLEKTSANNYRLRIYPLPSNGERKVELHIEQDLFANYAKNNYQEQSSSITTNIPLQWLKEAKSVNHSISTFGWNDQQISIKADNKTVKPSIQSTKKLQENSVYKLTDARKQLTINLTSDSSQKLVAFKQNYQDEDYLYAEIPTKLITNKLTKDQLKTVADVKELTVVWDTSLSGLQRDTKKEIATLTAYLKQLKNVTVSLIEMNNSVSEPKKFIIKNGDISDIKKALETLNYDGASTLTKWQMPKSSDAVLIFTDGLENMRETSKLDAKDDQIILPFIKSATEKPLQLLLKNITDTKPMVKFISSNSSANHLKLAEWARLSHGSLVQLNKLNKKQALDAFTNNQLVLNNISSEQLTTVNTSNINFTTDQIIRVSGKFSEFEFDRDITLVAELTTASGKSINKLLTLPISNILPNNSIATKWADMRIETLSADSENNKEDIIALGKNYQRITDFTSLIVLDNIEDYVTHRIQPPRSLLKEYNKLVANEDKQKQQALTAHMSKIKERQKAVIDWWNTDYPLKPISQKRKAINLAESAIGFLVGSNNIRDDSEMADSAEAVQMSPAPIESTGSSNDKVQTNISSTIKAWSSDKTYIKALEASFKTKNTANTYNEYLAQRSEYLSSPSFYLDVAEFFFNNNEDKIALRVLSNLAEISNNDRQLLRILAYRLSQAKRYKEAVIVLQKVKKLAPNEPQSWRDLGLAYADAEQWQLATDHLWHVISNNWDERFSDIDLITLNEFNSIIAKNRKDNLDIDTENYDKELIKNLPVGMRVVLSWDTDNSDMDLWVTDPNQEKVFYSHPLSKIGGRISRDFTGGYGPEEFMLKKPIKGKYTVRAHFYGSRSQKISTQTTLQLRFFENYGKSNVQEKRVMLTLEPNDEDVLVGEFIVD